MKIIQHNSRVLLILFFLFISPGIMAYLLYMHPQWLSLSKTNKGHFLNPPLQLPGIGFHKWRLMVWNPGVCQKECLQLLDKVGRVRLALGRRLYEVDQWLVVDQDAGISQDKVQFLQQQDIRTVQLPTQERVRLSVLPPHRAVFIVNPDNYLILRYAVDVPSADIYHDIKQLLTTSRKSKQ